MWEEVELILPIFLQCSNMPIRHTKKGWYWGSKGPFKTRKKAVEVAGAAYSRGYKKSKNDWTEGRDIHCY